MANGTGRHRSEQALTIEDMAQVWMLPEVARAARQTRGLTLRATCDRIEQVGGRRVSPSTLRRWELRLAEPRIYHEAAWRTVIEDIVRELGEARR